MATRVPVSAEPMHRQLPQTPVGKVHRRVVVEETSVGEKKPGRSIRDVFTEMLDKNAAVLANDGAADAFADLFVNNVKEERGWHGQVMGIADSLEQNSSQSMQELGRAIKHHADQVWAMRHVDDSKRSG